MANYEHENNLIPIDVVVQNAAADMNVDYETVKQKYFALARRCLRLLEDQQFQRGIKPALLYVDSNFHTAQLPLDFKTLTFVGYIDSCGKKVAISSNYLIINTSFVETIEGNKKCSTPCENECKSCGQNKDLTEELQSKKSVNKVKINNVEYDEQVEQFFNKDGSYYTITISPFFDTSLNEVKWLETKSETTKFQVEQCGCLSATAENASLVEKVNYDLYCTHCTSCDGCEIGADYTYRVFEEKNLIQFSANFKFEKAYIEYRGSMKKINGTYHVPAIAEQTMTEFIKWYAKKDSKTYSSVQIRMQENDYKEAYNNMKIVKNRMPLSDFINLKT